MRELHVNNVIIIRFKNLIITCSLNELLKTIDYKLAIFCIYQLMLFIQTIRRSRCCMYITRQAVPFRMNLLTFNKLSVTLKLAELQGFNMCACIIVVM